MLFVVYKEREHKKKINNSVYARHERGVSIHTLRIAI